MTNTKQKASRTAKVGAGAGVGVGIGSLVDVALTAFGVPVTPGTGAAVIGLFGGIIGALHKSKK